MIGDMSKFTERYASDPAFRAKTKQRTLESYRKMYADPEKRSKVRDQVKVRYAENVPANMLKAARKRAAAAEVPCTITVNDIFVPDVCPILGLELKVASGGVPADNSPSLDRRVPDKGYVPGNVAVISYLANRIKSNATPFQLRQIALWVEGGG